jgi:anti-anti-sigma factor
MAFAMPVLDVVVLDHGATRLVALSGELDISSVEKARRAVRDAFSEGREMVVLDLGGVTFMDSCGVHLAFEGMTLAVAHGARFVIVPGPPHVDLVFELAGVVSDLPFAEPGSPLLQ